MAEVSAIEQPAVKPLWRLMLSAVWAAKLRLLAYLAVLMLSLTVVYVTYQTRLLTAEKNSLLEQSDALDVEWRHLLLEQQTLAEHSRIRGYASKELGMVLPKANQQVVIKQ